MTRAVATGTVLLPFTLDICAVGDRVAPVSAHVEDADVIIGFPPSMTEGALGKSIYPDGMAWWVVDRLSVEASAEIDAIGADVSDISSIRGALLTSAQEAVRRFLNAYRWRLHQPQVHPVAVDAAAFSLALVHADGTRDLLPDAVETFFFNRAPAEPPLDSSINAGTLDRLQLDVLEGIEPPHNALLDLDIEWLQHNGESTRARELALLCGRVEPFTGSEDANS